MKRTIILILISLFVIIALPASSLAMYNTEQGRFLQRDPLGTGPRVEFSQTDLPYIVGKNGPIAPNPTITIKPILKQDISNVPRTINPQQFSGIKQSYITTLTELTQSQYANSQNLYQ